MTTTYKIDVQNSAHRHLQAAEQLYSLADRKDVAGYLYGIAAECAIKKILSKIGLRKITEKRSDPFFAHFPELKTLLRNNLQGRSASILTPFISDQFMQGWDVKMRYSNSNDIDPTDIVKWKSQAKHAVNVMNGA